MATEILCIKCTGPDGYCGQCGELLESVKQKCRGPKVKPLPPVKKKLDYAKMSADEVYQAQSSKYPKSPDYAYLGRQGDFEIIEVFSIKPIISGDKMFVTQPLESQIDLGTKILLKESHYRGREFPAKVTWVETVGNRKVIGFRVAR